MSFKAPDKVYKPREDSFLAGRHLEEKDLAGKKVLDMGTGTGFLAVICSKKGAEVDAVDINHKALKIAKENADINEVEINYFESDLFENVDHVYDLIIFNAPYLPGERENSDIEEKSWVGGEKGREVLDRFLEKSGEHLSENGSILIVQSSLTGLSETKKKLECQGFNITALKEKKVPWEKLLLIEASKF